MVMYPPIPRDWQDTESYEFMLQQHEQNCKIAVFLGELTGIVVHCFVLFETQVPNNKGGYYQKKSWNKEALIGQTGKFTKEFFTRQKEELTLLLRSLCNARTKEFSTQIKGKTKGAGEIKGFFSLYKKYLPNIFLQSPLSNMMMKKGSATPPPPSLCSSPTQCPAALNIKCKYYCIYNNPSLQVAVQKSEVAVMVLYYFQVPHWQRAIQSGATI